MSRRRSIRAALDDASTAGTMAELLMRLSADGSLADKLGIVGDPRTLLGWSIAATRGRVAET